MEKIIRSICITLCVFFGSLILIAPIIQHIGYGSAGDSGHLMTHSILFGLIFTVIYCTLIVLEEINSLKKEIGGNKRIDS